MSQETADLLRSTFQNVAGVVMAAALATGGWFFSEAFADLSDHATRLARIEEQSQDLVEADARIVQTMEKISELSRDNDRRITRREDNQFTARDGAKLNMQVAENSTLVAQQSALVAGVKEDLGKLENGMQRIWDAVRQAPRDQ